MIISLSLQKVSNQAMFGFLTMEEYRAVLGQTCSGNLNAFLQRRWTRVMWDIFKPFLDLKKKGMIFTYLGVPTFSWAPNEYSLLWDNWDDHYEETSWMRD